MVYGGLTSCERRTRVVASANPVEAKRIRHNHGIRLCRGGIIPEAVHVALLGYLFSHATKKGLVFPKHDHHFFDRKAKGEPRGRAFA